MRAVYSVAAAKAVGAVAVSVAPLLLEPFLWPSKTLSRPQWDHNTVFLIASFYPVRASFYPPKECTVGISQTDFSQDGSRPLQCTLYGVQCTVYTVRLTLYGIHCTVYSV